MPTLFLEKINLRFSLELRIFKTNKNFLNDSFVYPDRITDGLKCLISPCPSNAIVSLKDNLLELGSFFLQMKSPDICFR